RSCVCSLVRSSDAQTARSGQTEGDSKRAVSVRRRVVAGASGAGCLSPAPRPPPCDPGPGSDELPTHATRELVARLLDGEADRRAALDVERGATIGLAVEEARN
ncbi:hypothetical protein CF645_37495, partial [Burkholderia pseudomallei]|uniref:hypothetical protein n=1 Tax=Burkholderia pseudomallei TaxID=28450 RepID=UPI000CCF0FBE